jgi:hypothetical protein
MKYFTLLPDARDEYRVAIDPGPKGDRDGGPWLCAYTVPKPSMMRECAERAEAMLWRTVKRDSPATFLEARKLGYVGAVQRRRSKVDG